MDPFTQRRLQNSVSDFRQKTGQLPTQRDLVDEGFSEEQIKTALKKGVLEEYYVTLTSGAVVKGYKIPS